MHRRQAVPENRRNGLAPATENCAYPFKRHDPVAGRVRRGSQFVGEKEHAMTESDNITERFFLNYTLASRMRDFPSCCL